MQLYTFTFQKDIIIKILSISKKNIIYTIKNIKYKRNINNNIPIKAKLIYINKNFNIDSDIGLKIIGPIIFDGNFYSINIYGYKHFSGLIKACFLDNNNNLSIIRNITINSNKCYLKDNAGWLIQQFSTRFKLENCYNLANINGKFTGGLCGSNCGENDNIILKNCLNKGLIRGVGSGGLIGSELTKKGECNLTNCSNTGDILGNQCGGIIGLDLCLENGMCTIKDCDNTGEILGENNSGMVGLIKKDKTTRINIINCISINKNNNLYNKNIFFNIKNNDIVKVQNLKTNYLTDNKNYIYSDYDSLRKNINEGYYLFTSNKIFNKNFFYNIRSLILILIRIPLFFIAFIFYTIFLFLSIKLKIKKKYNNFFSKGLQFVSVLLLLTIGIKVKTIDNRKDKTYYPNITISNHITILDPILLCVVFGSKYGYLSSSESKKNKLYLLGGAALGIVYIDYKNKGNTVPKIKDHLKNKNKIIIFPEGRTSNGISIYNYKSGAFNYNSDILPCLIHNKNNKINLGIKPPNIEINIIHIINYILYLMSHPIMHVEIHLNEIIKNKNYKNTPKKTAEYIHTIMKKNYLELK